MTRVARIVVPDCPHHITQRGNNRQDVFFVPDDYEAYLEILKKQSERYGVDVHAYCLMTNHVHLVATPHAADSLAKAVGRTHWLYSQAINRLHGRSGHLWQGRFYSCALDPDHYGAAMRYVERNPVRARLHRKAWLYPWSSAAAHCGLAKTGAPAERKTGTGTSEAGRSCASSCKSAAGGRPLPVPFSADAKAGKRGQPTGWQSPFSGADPSGLLDLHEWGKLWTGEQWAAELTRRDDAEFVERLRSQTGRGRPLGSDSFLSKAEKLIGRRLRPLPGGRPRKKCKKTG